MPVRVKFGWWTEEIEIGESSIFWEATNLVIKVIRMITPGHIKKGLEVFVSTDNVVMEQTYTKGSSRSCKLHDLIEKLRELEIEGMLIIHFV